jgi:prepilin-type N-terminal cleavage/methylation domain-containing protein
MLKLHSERGDTIIEVLIVLSILGSALTIAYSVATRSLSVNRGSQEHSEALHYLTSQVELLRSAQQNGTNIFTGPGSFCITGNPAAVKLFAGSYTASNTTADADDFHSYPTECTVGEQSAYHVSITYEAVPAGNPTALDLFTFYVRWDGSGNSGRQQETLTYKAHS